MLIKRTDNFKNIIFIAMTILAIIFISQMKTVALLAFASFVLACSLNPAVDKFSSCKKISRALASTIVITLTILIVVLFFIPVFTIAIQEIHQLMENIPTFLDKVVSYLNSKTFLGKTLMEYINIDSIASATSQVASGLVNKSVGLTMGIMEAITVIITMGVIVFYLTSEKNILKNAIVLMFPPKLKDKAGEVFSNIERKVGGYVIAQILSMITVAIFTSIGLLTIKVEYAILLGLIAGLLDIIPIVGPTIAFVLGVLCASPQGIGVVVITMIIYLAAQWISNNFIRPYVFGKFLDLHPLIVIFAFLISAQFLGVWGVILSPAIAALLLTLFDELYLKTINNKQKDEEIEENNQEKKDITT